MNSPEVIAALVAGVVSILGLLINSLVTLQVRRHERALRVMEQQAIEARIRAEMNAKREEWQTSLTAQEQQWQESFRAELRRNLIQESTLEVTRLRLKRYSEVWKELRITSDYEWRNLADQKTSVKQLA